MIPRVGGRSKSPANKTVVDPQDMPAANLVECFESVRWCESDDSVIQDFYDTYSNDLYMQRPLYFASLFVLEILLVFCILLRFSCGFLCFCLVFHSILFS